MLRERVEAPDEVPPDLTPEARILNMNPNYSAEIRKMSNEVFTYIEVEMTEFKQKLAGRISGMLYNKPLNDMAMEFLQATTKPQ